MLKKEHDLAPKEHDRASCLKKKAKLSKFYHGSCAYLAWPCTLLSLQNFNSFEGKHDRSCYAGRKGCYKLLEFAHYCLV